MMTIRPALRSQIGLITLTSVLFLAAISSSPPEGQRVFMWLAVAVLCVIIYRRVANLFYVEDRRVESRRGIIARDIRSIALADIRNINLKQGIVYRLLNVGILEFSSAGGAGIEVTWWGVKDPMGVKKRIEKMSATRATDGSRDHTQTSA